LAFTSFMAASAWAKIEGLAVARPSQSIVLKGYRIVSVARSAAQHYALMLGVTY
jgi:hypothetical protein